MVWPATNLQTYVVFRLSSLGAIDYVCAAGLCSTLSGLPNGIVSAPSQPVEGDRAQLSCRSGYELVGAASVTCQANGEWSPGLPSCECQSPHTHTHTHKNSQLIQHFLSFQWLSVRSYPTPAMAWWRSFHRTGKWALLHSSSVRLGSS